ncbi:MAG: ABC transporter substrate-binding protein [Acetobacteraceae bacterium]|nr:ABC transporter substrate-binding protein [Acetobacteraceae bacterium]
MITRSNLLRLGAAGAAMLLASPAWSAGVAEQAGTFIQHTGSQFSDLLVGADTIAEKKRRLQPFIDQVVDVEGAARFCLSRYWRQATPEQQREYLQLFHAVLLNSVVVRVGDYRNERTRVVIGRTEAREDGVYVNTTVDRPGNPPANVTWIVDMQRNPPKITDLLVEGTSLRLTIRNDYTSYLSHHGNDLNSLIDALRKQADQT